ncbi:MAG: histidinol dehydrogenase, partial [Clostridia bacterium]|nr:histidinol dehydrogenase [Clostridia bacterium]
MKIYGKDNCKELLSRGFETRERELACVKEILSDVRARGDEAVFDYEKRCDGTELTPETLFVSEAEFQAAYTEVSSELLASLRKAIENVYKYHKRAGRQDCVRTENGRTTGDVVRPVGAAGIYAPGGTAALSSSVIMGGLPAK